MLLRGSILAVSVALATLCGSHGASAQGVFTLTSPSFKDGERLAVKNAGNNKSNPNCVGENVSPALSWTNPPEGTKSYTVIMHHIDPEGKTKWYWTLYNIPGTALLLLVIFCTTDERNKARPQLLTAATIGLTVTLLISLLGPLTMACFNPARDFLPRLYSSLAGWGRVPFETNGFGWLTVYIFAPLLGGFVGGAIYRVFFKPAYNDLAGQEPPRCDGRPTRSNRTEQYAVWQEVSSEP